MDSLTITLGAVATASIIGSLWLDLRCRRRGHSWKRTKLGWRCARCAKRWTDG